MRKASLCVFWVFISHSMTTFADVFPFTSNGFDFSIDTDAFTTTIAPKTFAPPPISSVFLGSDSNEATFNVPGTLPIQRETWSGNVRITSITEIAPPDTVLFPGLGPLELQTPATGNRLQIIGGLWQEPFDGGLLRADGDWEVVGPDGTYSGAFQFDLSPVRLLYDLVLSFEGIEVGDFPQSADLTGHFSQFFPTVDYRALIVDPILFQGSSASGHVFTLALESLTAFRHGNGHVSSNVTLVPIPPTLWLLLSSLVSFAMLRLRRATLVRAAQNARQRAMRLAQHLFEPVFDVRQ